MQTVADENFKTRMYNIMNYYAQEIFSVNSYARVKNYIPSAALLRDTVTVGELEDRDAYEKDMNTYDADMEELEADAQMNK